MKVYVVAYAVTGLVFFLVDAAWLSLVSQRLYKPLIGDVLLDRFQLAPAVLFYLVYAAGIVVFAITPALQSGLWTRAVLSGALFGFFAYATYDLTNQATIRGWPVAVTAADMCWGVVLTGFSAGVGFCVVRFLTLAP